MREDTGRPDIGFHNVFIDSSSREYYISVAQSKQIIERGAVEIVDVLRESQDFMEQQLVKLRQIEAHLSEVTGTEYTEEDIEDA